MKFVRQLDKGMGKAIFERTYARAGESWEDVAHRVAKGNCSVLPDSLIPGETEALEAAIAAGAVLMSGRHLQHGDENQASKPMELYTNCSTAPASFIKFYLLLNGSGVGRSYDDALMVVDWAKAPTLHLGLSEDHPDFSKVVTALASIQNESPAVVRADLIEADARVKTVERKTRGRKTFLQDPTDFCHADDQVITARVGDTREGWAKALEIYESAAYRGQARSLYLTFSSVRPENYPIEGLQGRPASGPAAPMAAFAQVAEMVKLLGAGNEIERWEQALRVDHEFSAVVQLGGARRAARIAVKHWKDPGAERFVRIKADGGFWTANHSLGVDREFWETSTVPGPAADLLQAMVESSHATGEPGLVNVDRLDQANHAPLPDTREMLRTNNYRIDEARGLIKAVVEATASAPVKYIVNPCVTGDTLVATEHGLCRADSLVGKKFKAAVDGELYESTEQGFWSNGVKEVFKIQLSTGESVKATADHRFLTPNGWTRVDHLEVGTPICRTSGVCQQAPVDDPLFKQGWLVGQIKGDGYVKGETFPAAVAFWGSSAESMAERAVTYLEDLYGKSLRHGRERNQHDRIIVSNRSLSELAEKYLGKDKSISAVQEMPQAFVSGFLRGYFDSDGSVQGNLQKGVSIRLGSVDQDGLFAVQRMLASLGVLSSIFLHRYAAKAKEMPDGRGGKKLYECQEFHELVISRNAVQNFVNAVGFFEPAKVEALRTFDSQRKREPYKDAVYQEVTIIESAGREEVFDCTIPGPHCYSANGIKSHNCGEISLSVLGGYCVIADVSPANASALPLEDIRREDLSEEFKKAWDERFVASCQLAARALVRVNQQPAFFQAEVKRTQRIGVSLTGIHEYAWLRFGLTFEDLLTDRSAEFWAMLERASQATKDAANEYADLLGLQRPVTVTTIKPSGTVSKLFGLTEGAHLPPYAFGVRWVQYQNNDPLLTEKIAAGYPRQAYPKNENITLIGFPVVPLISRLGMPHVTTASEASPEQQYEYLRRLEKHWLGETQANQISYTLKINASETSVSEYGRIVAQHQPSVKCCSMLPTQSITELKKLYGYVPEEPVSAEEFLQIVEAIKDDSATEGLDMDALRCASGACPI